MIVQCPNCPARLNVPYPRPENAPPVQCPRCQSIFQPPEDAPPEAEAHEEQPAANQRRRPTKTQQKKFPVALVGGALLAIGAVVGLVYAFAGGDKPKPVAAIPEPPPPKPTPPKKDTPRPPLTQPKLTIPAEYAELFATTVPNRTAPTVFMPVLQKVGREELSVPPFAEKMQIPDDGGKMTLEETKKATTFIKVVAGAVRGSGSGFVVQTDRDEVLVATNFHVISPRSATPADGPVKITVVFESGLPDEWERPGEVVAIEPELDLALVRVSKALRLPKPILPALAPKPTELMEVRICGFPFGGALALGKGNPNITIGKGAVSSVRLSEGGMIGQIQLDGSLNPGNSGGPVVDAEGRLVGVAVATIKGTGIGFAIPAHELAAMLAGRVQPAVVLPVSSDGGPASFKFLAPVIDPLGKVKSATLHVWNGDKIPEAEVDPETGWKLISGASKVELGKVELSPRTRVVVGDFRLPAGAAGKASSVVLQLECRSTAGAVLHSKPIVHKFVLDGVPSAADAIPMETFRTNLTKYAGQVVAVRGKLVAGTPPRGAIYELIVTDDGDVRPQGITFVADRDVATQLNELPAEDLQFPVRLTLKVGKAAADGTTASRVTQVDFIGRGNRIKSTIPTTEPPTDELVALNRAPEKFAGQTLEVIGFLAPTVGGSETEPELSILFVSEQRPGNLHFTCSPGLAAKVKEASEPNRLQVGRFTVKVGDKELAGTGLRIVTVVKIELIGADGKLRKVLE